MPNKKRSTTVVIERDACIDEETTRHILRTKVQPWLDELHKDDVFYGNLTFHMQVGDGINILTDDIEVTATVDVYEKEA